MCPLAGNSYAEITPTCDPIQTPVNPITNPQVWYNVCTTDSSGKTVLNPGGVYRFFESAFSGEELEEMFNHYKIIVLPKDDIRDKDIPEKKVEGIMTEKGRMKEDYKDWFCW